MVDQVVVGTVVVDQVVVGTVVVDRVVAGGMVDWIVVGGVRLINPSGLRFVWSLFQIWRMLDY